jgi:hypothetical protein
MTKLDRSLDESLDEKSIITYEMQEKVGQPPYPVNVTRNLMINEDADETKPNGAAPTPEETAKEVEKVSKYVANTTAQQAQSDAIANGTSISTTETKSQAVHKAVETHGTVNVTAVADTTGEAQKLAKAIDASSSANSMSNNYDIADVSISNHKAVLAGNPPENLSKATT